MAKANQWLLYDKMIPIARIKYLYDIYRNRVEENAVAVILVDYENVSGSNGLKGTDALCPEDTLIIFYSNCCGKIRYDYMQEIKESGCEFRIIKLKTVGKNALDFYIAAESGIIAEKGEKQIAIISNDKGFDAVVDFFKVNKEIGHVQIVRAGNIETAFTLFQETEGAKQKEILRRRMSPLDLAVECAKIEERNAMRKEIDSVLSGTGYEGKSSEIIDLIAARKERGRKAVYTGSLNRFGRKAGTEIYQLIKNRLDEVDKNENVK